MTGSEEITCAGAIVFDDAGRLLLIRRANPPAQGSWSLPGGRVEPGESSEDAVVRELLEETGLSGTIEREVGSVERDAPGGGIYLIRYFVLSVSGSPTPLAGDDAAEAGWFTPSEVRALNTSPDLVEVLAEWGLLG